jgi:3-oxoacyl-[acyl-carrier-protein] synthase II
MEERRVVITGMGAVTPVGIGVADFWKGLVEGRNGVGLVSHFDAADYRSNLAAEVQNFDPTRWIESKTAKRMDPFTQFAVAAADMAVQDSGLVPAGIDLTRIGVIIGSGIGGSKTIEDGHVALSGRGPGSLHPFFVSMLLVNMAASMVSIRFGFQGPMSALSVACSTGANAIGDAYRIIQRGDADAMVAGSAEACISPLAYGGFCATRSMSQSKDPKNASRPFDKNRDGFVMGEGAGIVVLEELSRAQQRGAEIYAEIAGYGNTSDAFHFTAPEPDGRGMAASMSRALEDAGMMPENVNYINAHGTSTVLNDKCESAAITRIFGDHAGSLKISSIKSMIGHLMAAAGSVECVATAMSIYSGRIPPTINYSDPDPDCPLDYVSDGAISVDIEAALSNSFGFGGGNVSLLLKKYKEKK